MAKHFYFKLSNVNTSGDCYRADHLLEAHLEKQMASKGVSQESKDEMDAILRQIDNYGMQVIFNPDFYHYLVNPRVGTLVFCQNCCALRLVDELFFIKKSPVIFF